MNIEEIIASSPEIAISAVALYKVAKVEQRLDTIMTHLNIPRPPRKRGGAALLILACLFFAAACTTSRQRITEEIRMTNGTVTIRSIDAEATVLGDGEQTLAKMTLSAGKTLSVGMHGVEQTAAATNAVEALRSIDSILGKLRP